VGQAPSSPKQSRANVDAVDTLLGLSSGSTAPAASGRRHTAGGMLVWPRTSMSVTQNVPPPLRRLLPDPLRSFEEWRRFTHEDLADMTPAARRWEAHRIRVAAALVDDDRSLPSWLLERLVRLAA
jgi:hypothetical protein